MFAQNIKPTTIPPYNRGVLALVVLLGITMIVTFCGMSGRFQKLFQSKSFEPLFSHIIRPIKYGQYDTGELRKI